MTSPSAASRSDFSSLAESTAADWGVILPHMQQAQRGVADRVMTMLGELDADGGGFPVSRLEHCLQTATRAERDNRDDEYVFCALIHDVGDMLSPFNHADVAASVVRPFVSEAAHFLVQNHDVFQGYFYWQHLGADPNARDKFRDSPHFDHTAEFCELYDQVAFDASYTSNPLGHFEPLVRQFLSQQ